MSNVIRLDAAPGICPTHANGSPKRLMSSNIDRSANLISRAADGGFYEARYVRRVDDTAICYLSTHSGCRMACRFCHLTATGQTMMTPATLEDLVDQAQGVMTLHDQRILGGLEKPARRLHVNFMARGEPLLSPVIRNPALFARFREHMRSMASARGMEIRLNISTILPAEQGALDMVFDHEDVRLYVSVYSLNPAFRRRWLPRAATGLQVIRCIQDFQRKTGRPVALHHAFIRGENDAPEDSHALVDAITRAGISAKFNIVRLNPPAGSRMQEATEERIAELAEILRPRMELGLEIIPRVGQDVFASCGMFVPKMAA